jgi:hypothetical protein
MELACCAFSEEVESFLHEKVCPPPSHYEAEMSQNVIIIN